MNTAANFIKRRKTTNSIAKTIGRCVTVSLMLAGSAHAQTDMDAKKLAAVTQMYAQDIQNDGLGKPVLHQFASESLSAAFKREQDYFDKKQMICGTGYDVLWESQDPDYAQDKTIAMHGDLVAVTLAHGDTVQYKMVCDEKCAVDDVIMSDGKSLKNYLNNSCQ